MGTRPLPTLSATRSSAIWQDSSVREPEDLKAGDVVYDDNMERYGVVLQVDTSDDTVQYATVEDEEINWGYWCDFDDLSDMTTRYP